METTGILAPLATIPEQELPHLRAIELRTLRERRQDKLGEAAEFGAMLIIGLAATIGEIILIPMPLRFLALIFLPFVVGALGISSFAGYALVQTFRQMRPLRIPDRLVERTEEETRLLSWGEDLNARIARWNEAATLTAGNDVAPVFASSLSKLRSALETECGRLRERVNAFYEDGGA